VDRFYDLKVLIVGVAMGFALLLEATPAFALLEHGDQVAVVTNTPAGRVRARSIPKENAGGAFVKGTPIGWIPEGTSMKLIERQSFGNEGEWFHVELPSGEDGWITSRYLTLDIARDKLIVLPTNVNIRNQPSVASPVIGRATKGTVLGMVRERNGWFLANIPNARKRGWIRGDMVRHEPLNPAAKPPPATATEKPAETPPPVAEPEPEKPKVDFAAQAREMAGSGQHKEAAEVFRKAVAEEPMNGPLLFDAAKTFEKAGARQEAIDHYRRAIKGRPSRPEAQFYLDRLLKPTEEAEVSTELEPTVEEEAESFEFVSDYAGYLLPMLAVGTLAFVAVLVVVYRKRRAEPSHPMYRRRQPDGGFDDVLKHAVEKRPVIREIEEAEKKLAEMDEALRKRVDAFGASEDGRPTLPPGESAEVLLGKIEGLRKTVLNQEERSRIYADLVYLQNEKITALDEEIDALKKLIKLEYSGGKGESAPKAVAPKAPAKQAKKASST
tara:strand:- start:41 stop:1531 length:1491 start_codon:yes stop_codon:yes gene_type:complete